MMAIISQKLKSIDKPAAWSASLFLLKTVAVYAMWKSCVFTLENVAFLTPYWDAFRDSFGHFLAITTEFIVCDVLGFEGRSYDRVFLITGTNGIAIKNSCIGLSAMAIFAGLIAVYPGKWKHKLWYIPLGMILVQASNLFRLASLSIMQKYSSEAFVQFNHGYTYLIITYSFIFMLVVHWFNKWADR
jgi:exosortase/archaeosortase family protein